MRKLFKNGMLFLFMYLAAFTGCAAQTETADTVSDTLSADVTSQESISEEATETSDTTSAAISADTSTAYTELTAEDFVSEVKTAIDGDVGKDEVITDVVLDNKTLTVFVNIDNANIHAGFTAEDIALSRVSAITDDILELSDYYEMWSEIIIDFGDVGYVKNTKGNVVNSEYGRYFDNFSLQS